MTASSGLARTTPLVIIRQFNGQSPPSPIITVIASASSSSHPSPYHRHHRTHQGLHVVTSLHFTSPPQFSAQLHPPATPTDHQQQHRRTPQRSTAATINAPPTHQHHHQPQAPFWAINQGICPPTKPSTTVNQIQHRSRPGYHRHRHTPALPIAVVVAAFSRQPSMPPSTAARRQHSISHAIGLIVAADTSHRATLAAALLDISAAAHSGIGNIATTTSTFNGTLGNNWTCGSSAPTPTGSLQGPLALTG